MPMDKVFIVGLVGNATSFAVYASPIPTFCIICRKKATDMFSVVPYIFTLLTALLGLYYGMMKSGGMLIMTVNGVGCLFELSYIIMFYMYAATATRRKIWKLVIADLVVFGTILGSTLLATHGKIRVIAIGSVSSAIAIAMYASPLSIMRTVIRTKNVEAMPLTLSIFLLINGLIWSGYALLTKDIFIGIPSGAGSFCAAGQIVLYMACKISRDKQQRMEKEAASDQAAEQAKETSKEHVIDVRENGVNGNDHKNPTPPPPPPRQGSLRGNVFRTASGKVVDLIKEVPNGLIVYRTTSGKDGSQYVELSKQ